MTPYVLLGLLALASSEFVDWHPMTPINDSSCRPSIGHYCASLSRISDTRDPCQRSQAYTDYIKSVQAEQSLAIEQSRQRVVAQTALLHTYLQYLATWRTTHDVFEVCHDGVDARLMCNRPSVPP